MMRTVARTVAEPSRRRGWCDGLGAFSPLQTVAATHPRSRTVARTVANRRKPSHWNRRR